jgi:hypothetical protein
VERTGSGAVLELEKGLVARIVDCPESFAELYKTGRHTRQESLLELVAFDT